MSTDMFPQGFIDYMIEHGPWHCCECEGGCTSEAAGVDSRLCQECEQNECQPYMKDDAV